MDNSKEYLDKVSTIIEKPYFQEMRLYGVYFHSEQEYIISKIFGFVKIQEIFNIFVMDDSCNVLYKENNYGIWEMWEYDSDGKEIYYENCNGRIIK